MQLYKELILFEALSTASIYLFHPQYFDVFIETKKYYNSIPEGRQNHFF